MDQSRTESEDLAVSYAAEPLRDPEVVASARGQDDAWLTDEEQWIWRTFLAVHRRLMESLEKQLQRDAAMSLQDYVILSMLSEAPDQRLRMTDLAFISHSSPSRISHAVDRLENRRWVRRERSDEDGRGSLAVLTEIGMKQVETSAPGHAKAVRRSLFDLVNPDELAVFGRVLFAVMDRFHETEADGEPGR